MKTKILIILLALGFLLRIALSMVSYNGDVNTHISWGKDIVNNGTRGFYERDFSKNYDVSFANYPPITMIFFSFSYNIYALIGPFLWKLNTLFSFFPSNFIFFWKEQKFMLPALMKIWAILADIGLAYVTYLFTIKLIKSKYSKLPLLTAGLILFNPAFFYNSSYWGQIDALPLFFIVSAFYLLLYKKSLYLSSLFIGIALLTKQTAFIFVPIFGLVSLNRFGINKTIRGFFLILLIIWVSFLPFIGKNTAIIYPFATYWYKILNQYGSDYLTAHAFNFWGLTTGLGHIQDLKYLILGISARYVASFFVGLIILSIIYKLYRSKYNNQYTIDTIASLFLIPWTIFLFSTRMHERHLLMTLPFLLIFSIKNTKLLIIFIFLSLFNFLNLYNGWWSPHPPEFFIQIFSFPTIINTLIIFQIMFYLFLTIKYFKCKIDQNAQYK